MLKPRLRMSRPNSIASSARAWPTIRVSGATSDVVANRNRFGSHGFRSSSGFRVLATGSLPFVRRRKSSLDPEVDPAVPQLLFPLRDGEILRHADEVAGLREFLHYDPWRRRFRDPAPPGPPGGNRARQGPTGRSPPSP